MNTADFWNGIIREHADALARVIKPVAPVLENAGEYRGWSITWDYGSYTATSPNYDASWEGYEDGWVDNGERVSARTIEDLRSEVDAFLSDKIAKRFGRDPSDCEDCDGFGMRWNNADPTSGQWDACDTCLDTRGHP